MKFICQKPSRFCGRDFMIGEEIPAELIDPSRIPALLKYGTIVSVEEPQNNGKNDDPGKNTDAGKNENSEPKATQGESKQRRKKGA